MRATPSDPARESRRRAASRAAGPVKRQTAARAAANQSSDPRQVMTMIYMDENIRVIEPRTDAHRADHRSWMPGVKFGEVAASPLNPVLWSSGI